MYRLASTEEPRYGRLGLWLLLTILSIRRGLRVLAGRTSSVVVVTPLAMAPLELAVVPLYPHWLDKLSRAELESQLLSVVSVRPTLSRSSGRGPLIDCELGRQRVVSTALLLWILMRFVVWLVLFLRVTRLHQKLLTSELPALRRLLLLQPSVRSLSRVA